MIVRQASFPPIVDQQTRLLILGSLPGRKSLAEARYYAHPQNQFWRLLGSALDEPLSDLDYEERLARLRARGVGLWDCVAEAEREGSLDGAIRNHRPNALAELVSSLPGLRLVAFNGGKASAIGRRLLDGVPMLTLPSSSPAYTIGFAGKLDAWRALAAVL